MAFAPKEMALLNISGAGSAIQHIYHYANTAGDAVTAANFFDSYAGQINTGDILLVSGASPRLTALTNTAGVITLTDIDVTAA